MRTAAFKSLVDLQLASWSYHGEELDVTNMSSRGDSTYFVDSGEWNLLGIPVTRNVLSYPCCEEPYPDVTFKIIFPVSTVVLISHFVAETKGILCNVRP